MPDIKILVIDDEQNIVDLIEAYLCREGYEVYTALDGFAGLNVAHKVKPDVIILDVMLPKLDGLDVLTQIRQESNAYVIMLTAKSEETDKIVGLSIGADDYMTKPFSPRELVARIKAALRRFPAGGKLPETTVLSAGPIQIDIGRHEVWLNHTEIELTAVEFNLLKTLIEHKGLVLSREQLLEKVWGHNYYGEDRVVDVHIGHIRRKLGDEHGIHTVRGVGYRLQHE